MAYKFSKGNRKFGDIKAQSDAEGDTLIDFDEDFIDLKTGDQSRIKISGSQGNITFNDSFTFPTSDGNSNQVLTTDGLGNLSFQAQATGSGANPPGGSDRQVQFNDNGSFAGNYGILVDTNFNLKVSGSLISKEAIGLGTDLGGGRNASDEWVAITEPQAKFHVVGDINESANFSIDQASNTVGGGYWTFTKARGTPSSPAGVNTNDEIARIQFFTHTGSSTLKRSALILAQADSDGDGRLKFYVTKEGDIDNVAIECYNNQVTIQDQLVIGSSGIIPITNGGASIGGSTHRFENIQGNNLVAFESLKLGGTHPIYDQAGFGISINKDHIPIGNYTSGDGLAYISNNASVENVILALHKTGSHFGGMAVNGTVTDNDQKVVFFSQYNTAGFEWRNNIPSYGVNGMGNLTSNGNVLMELDSSGLLTIGDITLPNTDGTNGQVLKTDGSGNVSWYDESGGTSLVVGFNILTGSSGDVDHDCSSNQIFYHDNISGAISPNFTNLSISNGESTVTKLILNQSTTAYDIESVSVEGTASSLVWEGSRPSAVANQISFAKFEILRISDAYTTIGSFSSTVVGGPVEIPSNSLLFLDASNSDSYGGSGTTWTDLSSTGNDATLVNTPTWNGTDKLFEFDGSSSQHITLPTGFADFTGGATFFFVADLGAGSNWERLVDFSVGGDSINVGRNSTGTNMTLEYYNPTKTATSSNIILNNTLANYVVTTDGTNAKFYRNGTLITTNSFTMLPGNSDRSQNYIGRSRAGGDAYYEGKIAVAGIFSRALTESEITDLYDYYSNIYSL